MRHLAKSATKTPKDSWRTPDDLFSDLNDYFQFTVDACASAVNAKLPKHWSEQDSALTKEWHTEVVFCNPPFSELPKNPLWVEKFRSIESGVVVLPVATDTRWFHNLCLPNAGDRHLVFLKGRVKYCDESGIQGMSPVFPSFLYVVGGWLSEDFFSKHPAVIVKI